MTEGKAMARYNVDLQDNEGNAYQIMANPDSVAEFSPAVNRENIRSGETYRVIFGKIMKYFSEVGNAAYVGLANNCTTTIAGFALDARQGKELMDRINELNRDLNAINDNGAIKGMDAREDGVYITYVPSSGADSVTKKLGSEPQLLGTLTGNGTFDCKKIANYKQLTKDNFFIIPKTVRARFNAPRGTDSSNMGWNSTKELKSIEYNADTGILSFYLTTSDSYSYGSYWTKSYSIDITGDLYCVF